MKKYLKIGFILLFAIAIFSACESDSKYNFEFSETTSHVRFYNKAATLNVPEGNTTYMLPVKLSGKVLSEAVTITVEVAAITDTIFSGNDTIVTTAAAGTHYNNLTGTTVTIPAGESYGYIEIQGLFVGLEADGIQGLVFNITAASKDQATYNQRTGMILQKSCPFISSDFAGTWTVENEWSFFDETNMGDYDVEITADANDPNVLWIIGLGAWVPEFSLWATTPFKLTMNDADPNNLTFIMTDYVDAANDWEMVDIGVAFGEPGGTFDVCNMTMLISWGVTSPSEGWWYALNYLGGGSTMRMQ